MTWLRAHWSAIALGALIAAGIAQVVLQSIRDARARRAPPESPQLDGSDVDG